MNCPRCKSPSLKTERYEEMEIDRCHKCQGTWLDDKELSKIIRHKEKKFNDQQVERVLREVFSGIPDNEEQSSELCPKCNSPMEALNYGYKSGVILDHCPNHHGVWLDKVELEKVQMYGEEAEKEASANVLWQAYAEDVLEGKDTADAQNRKAKMRPTKFILDKILRKLMGL